MLVPTLALWCGHATQAQQLQGPCSKDHWDKHGAQSHVRIFGLVGLSGSFQTVKPFCIGFRSFGSQFQASEFGSKSHASTRS